ncbi:hypothetical protein ACQEVB_31600 [Pseudonocardia sp. CA-107938]|uniref:hypothetical protein n=1 Tax=Pseudonocardia sp. CA-107938 TaxID=3240021 RepID=UPI003D91D4C3
MRTAYKVLAWLVAIEVVAQAAFIAWAVFGESKFIDGGGVVDKALVESQTADFEGVAGFPLHGINGQIVVPLIGLLLLVVAFFAKIERGVALAASTFGLIVLQVLLGMFGHGLPFLGLLHGLNALLIFGAAVAAVRAASAVSADRVVA